MLHKINIIKYILSTTLIFYLLSSFNYARAEDKIKSVEILYYDCVSQLDSMDVAIRTFQHQSDSLAQIISDIKEKGEPGFFESRKLNGHLRTSLQLASEQERSIEYEQKLKNRKNSLADSLIVLYTFRIDSLINVAENKIKGQTSKSDIIQQLGQLRNKRANLQQTSSAFVSSSSKESPILEPDDTPKEIEAKADFFRDQEDKARQHATLIESRINNVQEEITIRKRMAEFVDDIRLFDQREEAFTSNSDNLLSTESKNAPSDVDSRGGYFDFETVVGANDVSITATDQLLQYNFQNMPIYEIDEYIRLLEVEKQKLLSTADSLSKVAEEFDRQAKLLREPVERFHK